MTKQIRKIVSEFILEKNDIERWFRFRRFARLAGMGVILCISVSAIAGRPADAVPGSVINNICGNKFAAGKLSSVSILQSADLRKRVYLLRPDITIFSHASFTYFNDKGEELLTVPEFPLVPGKEPPILKERDKLIDGLKETGSFTCSGEQTSPVSTAALAGEYGDAGKFTEQFYTWLFKKADQTITIDKMKKNRMWFADSLIALWDKYERRVPAGDVGCLDSQPFTDAQDYVDRFRVGKVEQKGDNAVVGVDLFYGKEKRSVSVILNKHGAKWQIYDVYFRSGTLRKILSECF